MLKFATLLVLTSLLPVAGHAATITTTATALSDYPGGIVEDQAQDSFDTSVEEFGSTPVNADPPSTVGRASSTAYFQDFGRSLHASASAEKSAATAPSGHHASAGLVLNENYTAIGTGSVTVSLNLSGRVSANTDLENPEDFASVLGGYFLNAPGLFDERIFSSSRLSDPLFTADQGLFQTVLTTVFDISDGETFSLGVSLSARAGSFETLQQFFGARADIDGFLTVTAEGLELETGDGSVPSPVPLPATALMLLFSLGAFGAMRRVGRSL